MSASGRPGCSSRWRAAVAGGADELRRRPLVSLIACPVDPLGNDAVSLEAALVCAAAGVPCGVLSLTLGCGTAPASLAGNLVVNAAAVLADLVLLEIASPGAPVFFAGAPSVMDLRSGGYTGGGPEDDVLAAAATQLGHSFGLPVNMGTMATGAKEPGWQAAVDDALSTAASVLAGADMMSGCGLLDGSRTLSYPHLIMETEVYRIVQRLAEGIVVDDETLALDAIRRVGPNGTYLAERHTRRHAGEIWRPAVWDRTPYDAWLAGGRRGALEAARELARRDPRRPSARAAARWGARRAGGHRGAGRRGAAGLRRQSGDAWARGTCCVMQWMPPPP